LNNLEPPLKEEDQIQLGTTSYTCLSAPPNADTKGFTLFCFSRDCGSSFCGPLSSAL